MSKKEPQKFTPVPEKERCPHGNKMIVLSWNDMHLGEETARCPYIGKVPDFNPHELTTIKTVCKGICKVNRLNLMVEKLAIDKAKITLRYRVEHAKPPEEPRSLEEQNEASIRDATIGS